MAGGSDSADRDNIRAHILQTTLAEISATRQAGADAPEGGDGSTTRSNKDGENTLNTNPDCCVICLDTISEPCTARPCAHAHFDFLCLLSWLQQRASCPLCQSAVYKVTYTDSEKGEQIYRVPNAPRKRKDGAPRENAPEIRNSPAGDLLPGSRRFQLNGRQHQRRRRDRDPPRRPPVTPADALEHRRHVYRHQLYSLHIGSNRVSQYRQPPTPAQLSAAPHLVSRARTWIRRELQAFSFLSDDTPGDTDSPRAGGSSQPNNDRDQMRRRNNAEFLLEYIVAILKTLDMQDSAGQAEEMLSDFLGREEARLFLHELRSWLRSPCGSLEAWDREVQYPDMQRKRPLRDGEEGDDERQSHVSGNRRDRGGRDGRVRSFSPERKRRHREFAGGRDN